MNRDTKPTMLRALLFGALALTSGTGAMVALAGLISGYEDALQRQNQAEDSVMVLVAARDLYQGITITEEDLYAVQIKPRYLPEGVFLSPEHVVGRIPRERVLANEFVRAGRLADPESGTGLHAVVPRGMRAISVDVGDGAALSGFLRPGDNVDLLVTYDHGDGPETRTLLQAILVLGVNGQMQKDQERSAPQAPSVTLMVTPDQAVDVAHADNLGQIVLSLRHGQDLGVEALTGVDLDDLRSKLAPVHDVRLPPPPPLPPCDDLTMIHGPDKQQIKVNREGKPCE